mmetsp:Transcript_4336/g.18461  ORF Transcript_4336/g.18461 Transcript_4336/m.18461 type:complete len:124 (-) Transcript_4336:475-846(-)
MGNGNDGAVFQDIPEFYGSGTKTRHLYLGNGDDYGAVRNFPYVVPLGEISAGGGDDTLKLQFHGNVDGGPSNDFFYTASDNSRGGFDDKFPTTFLEDQGMIASTPLSSGMSGSTTSRLARETT